MDAGMHCKGIAAGGLCIKTVSRYNSNDAISIPNALLIQRAHIRIILASVSRGLEEGQEEELKIVY